MLFKEDLPEKASFNPTGVGRLDRSARGLAPEVDVSDLGERATPREGNALYL